MANNTHIDDEPHSILKLIMSYSRLEKKIQCYGTDQKIYHSEIHLISAIAKNPEINVKGLAELFQITSASVSEMLSKLQKKGLVEKRTDVNNRVSLQLTLTPKGKTAHKKHMQYHAELNQMVKEELLNYTDEQNAAILEFLNRMCVRLDEFNS